MAELLRVILESPLNFIGTVALLFLAEACVLVTIQAIGRHIMGNEEEEEDES
jgi:hypothetical protein